MPKAPHVVITGGASYASPEIAKKFKAEGYRVTLMGKNLAELDAIADEIQAYAIRIDLSDPASVETAFMQAGPVDVLVNCAVTVRPSQTLRTDIRVWEEHLKMNMTSAFLCSLKVLPSMIRRSKGCILNVPNYFGRVGGSHLGALSASMHGLIGFTRALAAEYNGQGIRINAVCPAHVECPLTYEIAQLLSTMDDGQSEESYIESFKAQNPNGEFLSAKTVADVIYRLSGEEAAGVHGQILHINEDVDDLGGLFTQSVANG